VLSLPAVGKPVATRVAVWSYSSMSVSLVSIASLKSRTMFGGPVSSTAFAAGTLDSRPACARTCWAGANTPTTVAVNTATRFHRIN
jgi:hypothetical protein